MAPRQPIPAPPAVPPRYSLVVVAADAELSNDALYGGWKFNPELCGPSRGGVVAVDCLGSFDEAVEHPGNAAQVTGSPFAIWASDECSTVGNGARDWIGRAQRALRATESYWLARELSIGEFGLDQKSLNDATADTLLGGTATEAVAALAALEEELGEQMHGQPGMIHVTESVLVLLVAGNAIRWTGTQWVTPMQNVVVADAGYVGAAPGETEATAGESWMYATSPIRIGLASEIVIVPESAAAAADARTAEAVDRSVNTATVRAARLATWVWDECVLIGVNVDTTFSGGGGGSPADTAAVIAELQDLGLNTDQIETLLGALGSNTDTLEALTAAPHAVEDAAYPASGHTGLVLLAKRADTPAASGADGDAIDPIADALGALWVHPVKTSETIKTTIAGLSNAAYAANEQLGTEITVAGASRLAGWGGVIGKLVVVDDLKVLSGSNADFDVYVFDQSVTGATDNNTFDDSDADMANLVDIIRLTNADNKRDHTSNTVYTKSGLSIPYTCVATSLFAILVTRTALSGGWSSSTGIRVNFGVLLD
jgi:hypothetical protein